MSGPLFLSDAAIAALDIPPAELRRALAEAFSRHADGRAIVKPKLGLPIGPGHFFQSMCAASEDLGFAACKWVGVAGANAARGLPTVNSLVVLSEIASGRTRAVLDGNNLTVLRTAAMSGLAAEHLARRDSTSIGFVGCGAQAEGHLHAFLDLLPCLREAVFVSRGGASAERLAGAARAGGLAARSCDRPDEALACDVVVTSVPWNDGDPPFLDARLLRPGSFVAAVDLARPWRPETLRDLDILAVDDGGQAAEPSTRSRLGFPGPFDADLARLVTGRAAGRTAPDQRAMFLFPGFALADLAAAVAILQAAERAGVGTILPA